MKQVHFVALATLSILAMSNYLLGYDRTYTIAYGAITLMALIISSTVLWLWLRRATPLALGMAFSWAGAGLVMGWWWSFNLLGRPPVMVQNPILFAFLALYFIGAVLHLAVIQTSFHARPHMWLYAIAAALGASVVASLL